jgi:DNA-binding transcriptional LysR family regulator
MRATDLSELSAFDVVAQHEGFTRAANEREVTASAISHAVSNLEDRLGVRLLDRTTRNVSLTDARDASGEPGSSLRCDRVRSR